MLQRLKSLFAPKPVESEAFFNAAMLGNRARVEAMLATNPNLVHARGEYGFTVLHYVAGEDEPELAQYLIDEGADISARNDSGMTPLHIASAIVVEVLVQRGADVNAKSHNNSTPLHVQSAEGLDTGALESMEALLKAGADPNLRDDMEKTPLDYSRQRNEVEKVRLLNAYGAMQ